MRFTFGDDVILVLVGKISQILVLHVVRKSHIKFDNKLSGNGELLFHTLKVMNLLEKMKVASRPIDSMTIRL